MAKFTVNKEVFWDAGTKKMSGRIKQIMGDYVVIKAADANYIVNKASLTIKPISRLASLCVISGLQDKHEDTVEITFDPKTGEMKMEWLDTYDENGNMKGCSSDAADPVINECDAIWTAGAKTSKKAWNSKPPPGSGVGEKTETKEKAKTIAPTVTPTKMGPTKTMPSAPTKIGPTPQKQMIGQPRKTI